MFRTYISIQEVEAREPKFKVILGNKVNPRLDRRCNPISNNNDKKITILTVGAGAIILIGTGIIGVPNREKA